jgi:ribonuclease HI
MGKFYAVAAGHKIGIFATWAECEKQVKGYPKACFKSFSSNEQAQAFLQSSVHASTAMKHSLPAVAAEKQTTKKRKVNDSNNYLSVHIMFDGGSRGNPGIAGSGASVTVSNTPPLTGRRRQTVYANPSVVQPVVTTTTWHIRHFVGAKATNNQAEYDGLLCGLERARKEVCLRSPDALDLIVQGDSDLILQQVKGLYQCRNEGLKPLHQKVLAILKELDDRVEEMETHLEHVYRKDNKVADGEFANAMVVFFNYFLRHKYVSNNPPPIVVDLVCVGLANEAMDSLQSWVTTSDDAHTEQFDFAAA